MSRYAQSLWRACGRVGFWLMWPLIYMVIGRSQRARVFVRCGNEVLLVRPWVSNGAWQLPGGGLKRSESAKDAAQRELREETGITLSLNQLHVLGESVAVREVGIPYRADIYSATLRDKPRVQKAPMEIVQFAWIPLNQLRTIDISPSTRQACALMEIAI